MTRVVLCRMATICGLGEGTEALWQGLIAGRTAVAPLTRFDCSNYNAQIAATIPGLTALPGVSRLDAIHETIAAQLGVLPRGCRLLLASTKGEIDLLDAVARQQRPLPQSVLFEPLLVKVGKRFGLEDSGTNINAACASSTLAVARGAAMIAGGTAEAVLVYAADLVSDFVYSGFSALQALSPEPARPFDAERRGLSLGEAGVGLLLMSAAAAERAGETSLATVAGWGAANDAHHVTAPARDGCGLIAACRQALQRASISPAQIAALNAHGTGTLFNDAMELTAFGTLFGDRLPPLHGIKGSLGHCLGAAGALEIAVAARALREGCIPPTVGCRVPEAAGQGKVGEAAQPIAGDYLLSCNSGFGGINGVVILQKEAA